MIEIKRKGTKVVLHRNEHINTLEKAELLSALLQGADLYRINLREANLRHANLRDADLRDADLTGALLRGASLQSADFTGADLQGAELVGANLETAILDKARLHSADLRHIKDFGMSVEGALYDKSTKWPAGFDPIGNGAVLDGPKAAEPQKHPAWWEFWK